MPRLAPQDGFTKFQRYRIGRRERGEKLLRLWVVDPRSPQFSAESSRQAGLLRGAPEEDEAIRFIEAEADWDESRP